MPLYQGRLPAMSEPITTAALIVAGGRGTRAGDGIPKQYRPLPNSAGKSALAVTLEKFATHPQIDAVCVVIQEDDAELYNTQVKELNINNNITFTYGGETRQNSVLNGLTTLAKLSPKHVLIHDAVRPYLSADLISRCITGLGAAAGAIPAVQVTDTLKRAENGTIIETVSRDGLWRAQTPQAFRFDAILAAHSKAANTALNLTDDAAIAEMAGLPLSIVAGEASNVKLTFAEDFSPPTTLIPRTGMGFDVHRFDVPESATEIMLGGISVPHNRALIGHSDADVGLHAITDAVLGALAEGDIGTHFPPSDAAHKDRPSADFLRHAVALAGKHHARITHIDVTFICEAPKIAPHSEAMRVQIATLTGLDAAAVSVKATTTEGLGATGRGEGIAAQAVATVLVPA